MRLPKPTPALVVSLVALFFALGGTALAVSSSSGPQPRCAQGAVRGIAVFDKGGDFSTLSSSWSSGQTVLSYAWSCSGGQVQIRKDTEHPGVDVRFAGNPAHVAVVQSSADGVPGGGSVSRQQDGSFLVTMGGSNAGAPGPWQSEWLPFTIVLF